MDEYYRGILFSLVGNTILNFGQHLKVFGQETKSTTKLVHYRTRKGCVQWNMKLVWAIFGHLLICMGSLSNAYAMAFAPQTLLSSIASIQFVVNLICSAAFYKTRIDWNHILGTIAVITGCLVLVFGFSPNSDTSRLTILVLFDNFNRSMYRSYLIVVIAVFCFSIIWQYVECLPARESQRGMKTKRGWVSGILYCICSAMPGTQSVVLGKTLAIIIRKSITKEILWFEPFSLSQLLFVIICIFAWLVTYAYWMHRQSEGLSQYDPMFIVPMHQVMWITFSIVSGGLYFQELESTKPLQWLSLLGGLFFNYLGLFQLMADGRKNTVEVPQQNMDLPLNKQKTKLIKGSPKPKRSNSSIPEMPLVGSEEVATYEVVRRGVIRTAVHNSSGISSHCNNHGHSHPSNKQNKNDMEINIVNINNTNPYKLKEQSNKIQMHTGGYQRVRMDSESEFESESETQPESEVGSGSETESELRTLVTQKYPSSKTSITNYKIIESSHHDNAQTPQFASESPMSSIVSCSLSKSNEKNKMIKRGDVRDYKNKINKRENEAIPSPKSKKNALLQTQRTISQQTLYSIAQQVNLSVNEHNEKMSTMNDSQNNGNNMAIPTMLLHRKKSYTESNAYNDKTTDDHYHNRNESSIGHGYELSIPDFGSKYGLSASTSDPNKEPTQVTVFLQQMTVSPWDVAQRKGE